MSTEQALNIAILGGMPFRGRRGGRQLTVIVSLRDDPKKDFIPLLGGVARSAGVVVSCQLTVDSYCIASR